MTCAGACVTSCVFTDIRRHIVPTTERLNASENTTSVTFQRTLLSRVRCLSSYSCPITVVCPRQKRYIENSGGRWQGFLHAPAHHLTCACVVRCLCVPFALCARKPHFYLFSNCTAQNSIRQPVRRLLQTSTGGRVLCPQL